MNDFNDDELASIYGGDTYKTIEELGNEIQ